MKFVENGNGEEREDRRHAARELAWATKTKNTERINSMLPAARIVAMPSRLGSVSASTR